MPYRAVVVDEAAIEFEFSVFGERMDEINALIREQLNKLCPQADPWTPKVLDVFVRPHQYSPTLIWRADIKGRISPP